jgi:manganese/iron transport system permease protein
MIEALVLPFQFPFMQNAFWVALIVAPPCALLSCFLVLKGWALMGDAVSHAVLPGIVIAYLAGLPLLLGAFVAGLGSALLTGFLADNSRVKRDTVMGVVFSGMFALGVVLHTAFPSELHLDKVLFGNMLGVGRADLRTALAIAAPVTLVLALKWRELMLHAFDPAQAQVSGLRTGLLHYGLLAILALTIVATLSSVGLILAIGLLIAPGAIAFRHHAAGRHCRCPWCDADRGLAQLPSRQRARADDHPGPDGGFRPGPGRAVAARQPPLIALYARPRPD